MDKKQTLEHLNNTEEDIYDALVKDTEELSYYLASDEVAQDIYSKGENEVLTKVTERQKEPSHVDEALIAAFLLGAGFFTRSLSFLFVFDPFKLDQPSVFSQYKNNLLNALNTGQIMTISQIFQSGRNAGWSVGTLQRNLSIGHFLTESQWRAVENYRRLLNEQSMEALKRKLRDAGMDSLVLEAFRSGKPLTEAQIDKLVFNYMQSQVKHRMKLIAETEATRAFAQAQESVVGQMIAEGVVYEEEVLRFWVNMRDEKVRASHKETPYLNKDGRRMGEPFVTPLGPLLYPGDPAGLPQNVTRCRCVLRYKFDRG